MTRNPLAWVGLAGIEPDDNARARHWQGRLHWVMVAIALLAIPAYLLGEAVDHPAWHGVARALDAIILVAFLFETFWMASISSFPRRYLVGNWLNFVILLASAAALLGSATEWIPIVRVLRAGLGGLVLLKVGADFSVLLTRRGAPLLTGVAVATALVAGGTLYWLEPNVKSYWDGVWLAFVTATTIGYGDIVPTTGPSRVVAVFVSLIGWALLSLFTANVVAVLLGRDEESERRRLAHEIAALRSRVESVAVGLLGSSAHAAAGDAEVPQHGEAGAQPTPATLADEIRALRAEVTALAERIERIAAATGADERRRGD